LNLIKEISSFLHPHFLLKLQENTVFQRAGFFVLLAVSLQFIITFLTDGISLSNVSLWGYDWGNLFGVVLFNFAAVLSVPAWLYEREKNVDVRQGMYCNVLRYSVSGNFFYL